MFQAIDERAWPEFKWYGTHTLQIRQTFEHCFQHDTRLQACQRCTQAEVDTMTKAQMTVGRALDIKGVSVRKLRLIEIGSRKKGQDQISRFHFLSTEDRIDASNTY